MRLVGVALVRDEADIIEAFVRNNLVLLDALYVMIHRSADGTREILHALAREGLQLRLAEIHEESFNQEGHTNNAARVAFAEDRADFVFPLDADEFIRADSRAALEQALAKLPAGNAGALPWLTYVPTAQDVESPLPLERIQRRFRMGPMGAPDLLYCKVVVGRWFRDHPEARIVEGNHAVFAPEQVRTVPCEGVTLCHFPVRSREQLAKKAALGWIAQLATGRPIEGTGVSAHWQAIFQALKSRGVLSDSEVESFVAGYVPPASRGNGLVTDPLPHRVAVERHAALQRPQGFVQALLQRAEDLAKAVGGRSPT